LGKLAAVGGAERGFAALAAVLAAVLDLPMTVS
jgi:hypothetical protein